MNYNKFTGNDTRAIKGIAVMMMLFHHLANFSGRYPKDFGGFKSLWEGFVKDGYLASLASGVRICVAVFFFLGGYGLYKRMEAGKFSLLDSVMSLYKKYWKVFVVFVPIAYIFFARTGDNINELCTRYNIADKKTFITTILSNFVALSDSINSEWWFVQTYICVLFLGTVYCHLTRKNNNFASELLLVFIIDILIRNVFPAIAATKTFSALNFDFYYVRIFKLVSTASAFFAGIVFAKYDGIVRIKKLTENLPFRPLIGLLGAAAVIWSRIYIMGDLIDLMYAILFTAFFSLFADGLKPVKKLLEFVGIHSTNIWLIHSFYCYYFLEATKLVYSTKSVWADFLILFALSIFSSVILEFIFKKLSYIITKLRTPKAVPSSAEQKEMNAVINQQEQKEEENEVCIQKT